MFLPSAKVKTSIIVLQKGVPHPPSVEIPFVYLGDAGLEYANKMVRTLPAHAGIVDWALRVVNCEKDVVVPPSRPAVPDCISTFDIVGTTDWCVESHVPWDAPSSEVLLSMATVSVKSWVAGMVLNCDVIRKQRATVAAAPAELQPASIGAVFRKKLSNAAPVTDSSAPGTFGAAWTAVVASDFKMGNLVPGSSLVVSAGRYNNGIEGTYDLSLVVKAPLLVRLTRFRARCARSDTNAIHRSRRSFQSRAKAPPA